MNPVDLVRQLVRYRGRVEIGDRSPGRSYRYGHRDYQRDEPIISPQPRSEHAFLLHLGWAPGLPANPQGLIVALFGNRGGSAAWGFFRSKFPYDLPQHAQPGIGVFGLQMEAPNQAPDPIFRVIHAA